MNDGNTQVDDYLQKLRRRGTLDSEGAFTVSGFRAVGKLAIFLLENDSDWLLKIVQAACLAQCPELRIQQTRTSTQIALRLPYVLNFQELEKGLTSATKKSAEPGLQDLLSGLRAVGVGQLRDWVLRAQHGKDLTYISCTEGLISAEQVESEQPTRSDVTELTLGVGYPKGQTGKVGGLIRFGEAVQNEHMALLTRARACPIPLYLDGRRIDDLSVPPMSTALETRAFLGLNLPPEDGSHSLRVPAGIARSPNFQLQDRFCSSDPYCISAIPQNGMARSLQRWYFNYTTTRESVHNTGTGFYFQEIPSPSRICLIRHGVMVAEKNMGLLHPISVDVFLPADHLRSDLTGLKVRPTDEDIALAKDEIRAALPFLERLFFQLQEHSPRPKKRQLLMYGGLGALGLLIPTLALKAVAGTVSTVLLARAAQQHQEIVNDCIKHLESFRAGVENS